MNKLNKTICNIHFLVLGNAGNSDKNIFSNTPKPVSQLSWIQKLYLEKALDLYKNKIPIIRKNGVMYWGSKFTKKKFLKRLPKLGDLTLNKDSCNYYMSEYSKVILKLTGNKKLKKQIDALHFGCRAHDSITWGVSVIDEPVTFYPQSNINLVKKNIDQRWHNYFVGAEESTQFLKIDPKYHFSWRNKLIPAHEVIHNVNKISDIDAHAISRSEWVASAANLNIYLGYLETKYHKIKKSKLKNSIQLEAIASVLYVVELINNINHIASTRYVRDMAAIRDWVNTGTSGNGEYITDILRAEQPLWRNTYSKHLAAIVYAFAFFENNNGDAFTKACITDSIWNQFDELASNKLHIDFWNKPDVNLNVSKWITEKVVVDIKDRYRFITNPINGKRVLVVSKQGQIILKNYLLNLKLFLYKNKPGI